MDNQVDQQTTQETGPVETTPSTDTTIQEPKWYDVLPDNLRTNKNITKFNTLEDFATWQTHASKLMGKKVTDLAPEDIKQFLTPEELIEAAQARGMPPSIDDYSIPSLEAFPDQEVVKGLKEVAFKSGITPEQTEKLIKYNEEVQLRHREQQKEAWTNELMAKYGNDTLSVMEQAKMAAEAYCSPELMKQLDAAGMGHNPLVVEAFVKVAQDMLPDRVPHGTTASSTESDSKAIQRKALLSDPVFYSRLKRKDPEAVKQFDATF